MNGDERALALGDVAAEVLLGGLLCADEIQDVVLDLERKPGSHTEASQRLGLLGGPATHDAPDSQRHRARVVGGLVARHHEVVVNGQVEATVACPADVECLALDGARGHVYELAQHLQLGVGIETGIVHDGTGDERERQVARVDRESVSLDDVHARLATARERRVFDVVMDERCRVEVLDRGSGGPGAFRIAADRFAREQADERTVPLPGVRAVRRQRRVEVAPHVGVRPIAEEGREIVVELLRVALQVELEPGHGPPSASVCRSCSPFEART